ncbi:uncharacterized small protein (DUF1192 family) [Rhizobium leguminosarum]
MTDEIARSRAELIPKGYLRAAVNLRRSGDWQI